MSELVTIIVASYNYDQYLPKTLDSLIGQSYRHWEAIVVDDGSRDSSVSIIGEYAQRDSRIRLKQHPGGINRGLGASIQLAISCAEGTWIAFCESDDWWNPLFLESAIKRGNDDPTAGLVFSDVILEGESPSMESHCEGVRTHFRMGGQAIELYRRMCNAVSTFSCAMVKSDLIRTCNFNAHFAPSLDMWLWAQLVTKTQFAFVDQPLVHWRQHDSSYMKKAIKPESLEMETVLEFHRQMKLLFEQERESGLSPGSPYQQTGTQNQQTDAAFGFGLEREPDSDLPLAFDVGFYQKANPDLKGLSDAQLVEHYQKYGQNEGRVTSELALRENLIRHMEKESTILEIGPFCNPLLSGPNVRYFDVLDQEGLLNRSLAIGYPHQSPPYIDYVSPTGDLGIISGFFSAVTSSHCIEHQPDLIRHLQGVGALLEPKGRYYLMIPDKRYCFDHFIPCSKISDVIDAYMEERKVHRAGSVVEHCALITHNDCPRHWQGSHADPDYDAAMPARIKAAMDMLVRESGKYIDVHAWQFTPRTFRRIIEILFELGLSPLSVERVYNSTQGRNEFTAVLRKS
jgi:hypothetical protein